MRQGDSDRDIAAARITGRPKAAQRRRVYRVDTTAASRCSYERRKARPDRRRVVHQTVKVL